MNKYKLLLFDLDGTLCDTDEMVVQTMFAIYKKYKPTVVRTREELYYFSGPPIRETLKREFPNYSADEMYDAFKRISYDFYAPYVKAYDGEVEVLRELKDKGYVLGVVTNKGLPLTIYSLELCGIKDLFDVIVTADDVAIPKPDPTGVFDAMKKIGIKDKKDVLYIGDNDIDYFTADNAQVDALLVTWGPREIKCLDKAKYQAKSYNEMREILL